MGESMRKASQARASVHEMGDPLQGYGNVTVKRVKQCTKALDHSRGVSKGTKVRKALVFRGSDDSRREPKVQEY